MEKDLLNSRTDGNGRTYTSQNVNGGYYVNPPQATQYGQLSGPDTTQSYASPPARTGGCCGGQNEKAYRNNYYMPPVMPMQKNTAGPQPYMSMDQAVNASAQAFRRNQ